MFEKQSEQIDLIFYYPWLSHPGSSETWLLTNVISTKIMGAGSNVEIQKRTL